ncbi:DsbA family protein [Marimonas lutisalis]|uniref:DsbA family protein n=1 Tax=Marimonas lutisalis TaxID=2545756 RepID=UPI0010F531D2|nr:DsbA family protein [Marimonas lutisalis]
MKRHLPLALVAGLAVTGPAAAFDLTSMSDAEREAFRAEIRNYLLENPQVIMEAVAVLEQREAEQQAQNDKDLVKVNAEALFDDPASWVGGNLDGDVIMVEFVDYRCGYCRKAHDEVQQLLETDGNIRMIVKEFPILGEDSLTSSRFAIATLQVAGDDAYKAVSEALIKLKASPEEAVLRRLAESMGLDAGAILAKMDSDEVTAVIEANHALAQRLRINGTPTFVLGDQMLRGYVPLANMLALVDDIRAQ